MKPRAFDPAGTGRARCTLMIRLTIRLTIGLMIGATSGSAGSIRIGAARGMLVLFMMIGLNLSRGQTPAPAAGAPGEPDWLSGRSLKPTYTEGAGLIIEHRCVSCHRPGEVAPISFLTYEEIKDWSLSSNTPMAALIASREMPPWPADPSVGDLANSRLLSETEIELLLRWFDEGLPRGEGQYEPETQWVEGWNIGRPDAVFELPEHTVGAGVEGEAMEFVVQTDYAEDRWIVAAEARPGNEFVVAAIDAGPLGSYRPGNSAVVHGAGTGRLLRAGASVLVRVQYRKDKGFEVSDQSKLGVVFAKDASEARREILEERMAAPAFTIPAGRAGFEVKASFEFPARGRIVSLMPVMHTRGSSVRYRAIFPGGGEQRILLSIPRWDPQWKYRYQLRVPMTVPKGTVVEAIAQFDNSEENIKNPDPGAEVRPGPAGEVLEGWIGYVLDGRD